jgi:hypothetical protein
MRSTLFLFWLALSSVSGAVLNPYDLECEAAGNNPVGIDVARPRLGWRLWSPGENEKQTRYQVQAASTQALLTAGRSDVWDSGEVRSEESSWVAYGGPALRPFQRVYWRVRVWNAAGEPSAWSGPAHWTMALTDPGQWRGGWIASPVTVLRSGPLPVFRKEFAVEGELRSATVLVSGAGFHELRVNGQKVGDHVLAPAWTNYRATMLYEAFDVTALLKQGPNAVGVMLGNGFYNVAGGRYAKYTGSFGQPRIALMLHLEYAGGAVRDIVSDGTWRVHDGPITFSCIYGGEDYDARLELAGWDQAGFDDRDWQRPAGMEAPGGVMRAQSSPPVRVMRRFRPVKVTEPKPGIFIYDLGQNFAGWPAIVAEGPAGARIKMIPGELLNAEGLVTQKSSGGPNSFTYTLKGGAREAWSPRFTYYGFRYVQVEDPARALREMEGQFLHLAAGPIGTFESSNTRFNQISRLIDAAVRSNLNHVLTDCPHREKLGWLEQTYLMGPSLLYGWDLRRFFPKMLRDIREAQLTSGLIPDIAPEYVAFRGGFRDSPEWGSAGVLVPWLAWNWYGDRQTLADSYESMRAYTNFLGGQTKEGLLTYGLGDWYDIGPKAPGYSQLTPQGITATATYWEDLRVMEGTARLLGRAEEAGQWAAKRAATLSAFQKAFYREGEKSYATGSQTSLAMPLAFGMAPEGGQAALAEKLVADIRARGNHTSAGDIGYRYVLAALTQAGRDDVVFEMANNPVGPSYAGQLAAGATALTEAWDASPNSSNNHLMLGHIQEWFYAGLAGIRVDPASPGLRNVRIEPMAVGDVDWVKAAWETFRGRVSVDWKREAGGLKLLLELPPGMTADVKLPGAAARRVGSGYHEVTEQGVRALPPARSPVASSPE